jgi:hypothetical protein
MVRLEREWQPRLAGADDEPKEPDDPRWKENWEEARAYGREPERRGVLYWYWDEAPSTGP